MRKLVKNIMEKNIYFEIVYGRLRQAYYKYMFSDKKFIAKQFKEKLGREVNLSNPERFTDKLQWLKLYWYDQIAIKCADKYEVRKIIEDKIGSEYLIKLISVYNSIKEINLDVLPNSFILKVTNGSGHNIICKDKGKVDWDIEFKKIKKWLNYNYYIKDREWVYKGVKPRVICEDYLSENDTGSLTDYKFYCFNGKPMYCQVIRGRGINETIDFYDTKWNHMPFTGLRPYPNLQKQHEKPSKYNEMIYLATILSKGFPFVRVDFYLVNSKIYFGELTFFPMSGMGKFEPDEWDYILGDLLELPNKN